MHLNILEPTNLSQCPTAYSYDKSIVLHVKTDWPTVKRRMDCGMDPFRGLTGSESML